MKILFKKQVRENHNFRATTVRPFNICRAVIGGTPITIYGDGTSIRAWCYITDMVAGVRAILHTPAAAGEVFNIGNPREVETTLGLARRVAPMLAINNPKDLTVCEIDYVANPGVLAPC